MKNKQLLVGLLTLAVSAPITANDTYTLSSFLKQSLSHRQNAELIEIEDKYREARTKYDTYLASFGFDLDYKYDINSSTEFASLDSTKETVTRTSTLTGTKDFPFLFGQNMSLSISNTFGDAEFPANPQNFSAQSYQLKYTLPITPDGMKYSEYQFKSEVRAFETAKITYIKSSEAFVRKLINTYVNYIDTLSRFKNAKQRFEDQKKLVKTAQAKYDLGDISGVELIKAKVTRIQEESSFLDFQIQFEAQKTEIKRLLNVSQEADFEFTTTLDFDLTLKSPQFYLDRIQYNKDYQTSVRALKDAEMTYLNTKNELLPVRSIDLTGSRTDSSTAAPINSYLYTASVTVPILDKGERDIKLKDAAEALKNSQQSFKDKTRQIHDDIIQAYNQVIQYKERRAVLELFFETAQKEYQISYEQFNDGNATMQDITNAITNLQNAIENLFQNKKNLILAIYDLKTKTGLFVRTERFVEIQ